MFRLALSFLRIKTSFLLPFSPPSLCRQYTLIVGIWVTLARPCHGQIFIFSTSSLAASPEFLAPLPGGPSQAEIAAVREEGAAAAMRGLAGPRRVFTWQDRQTVQALGLSQSISCETSLSISHQRLQRGCLEQLSRQHHQLPYSANIIDSTSAGNIVSILRCCCHISRCCHSSCKCCWSSTKQCSAGFVRRVMVIGCELWFE